MDISFFEPNGKITPDFALEIIDTNDIKISLDEFVFPKGFNPSYFRALTNFQ
jgi:hypothetical protein